MENILWNVVDVRDVADALLLAYETPVASGRYLCAPHPISTRDLVDLLEGMHPNYGYQKKFVLFPTFLFEEYHEYYFYFNFNFIFFRIAASLRYHQTLHRPQRN